MRVKCRCKKCEDLGDADNNQMLIAIFIYFIECFDKINEDDY